MHEMGTAIASRRRARDVNGHGRNILSQLSPLASYPDLQLPHAAEPGLQSSMLAAEQAALREALQHSTGAQLPPQSTSVSSPFCTVSEQLADAAQVCVPASQSFEAQSPSTPQPQR